MKKSDVQKIVAILKQYGNQRFNAFFAAILTSNITIPFYQNKHAGDGWPPQYLPEDTKVVLEQLPNLMLLNYDWKHFIVSTPDGTPSSMKRLERFLDDTQIKSVAYNIMPLSDFLNNPEDNDKLNIQNFIKSLIIELADTINNAICVESGKSNMDKVTSEKMNLEYISVASARINALFSLLKLCEGETKENVDLIPFIEEQYEIYLQLLNK